MRSRPSVPGVKLVGLERAARLAGEAFGHEDMVGLSRSADSSHSRRLWWFAAAVALAGLIALALR